MDGMKETKADMEDIIDIIDGLEVSGATKQDLLQLVLDKKKGDKEARGYLCKVAAILRMGKYITAEQQALMIVYATEKEQWPSDNGLWMRFKCWLKRFFS